jgi:hypothetical protein
MTALSLEGWIPVRIAWQGAEPLVEWCYLGAARFTHAFFDATIQQALEMPFNRLFRHQTSMEVLGEWHARSPGLKPTGFIFHMSRCGSTLVGQMLASLTSSVVLSEAGPIDALVRSHVRAPDAPVSQRIDWLRWMVNALGQRRTGAEQSYFIKFDGRSTANLAFVQEAFPDVPWIFLYRDPVEVMVSSLRTPSSATTPGIIGLDLLRLPLSQLAVMSMEEYTARVLGAICESAANCLPAELGKPIHYRQLPDAVWEVLAEHFGYQLTAADVARMREIAGCDVRDPHRRFTGDSESKQREASGQVRELAEQWVGPQYRRLESLRSTASAMS